MIVALLSIGVAMVASVSHRPWLIDLHRPLGIAVLLLAVLRLANRLRHSRPALPADLPRWPILAAGASHGLLYALMLVMPLLGWATVSAGGYPVEMFGSVQLPAIVSPDATAYACLRDAHAWLARLLFLTVLMHVAAALYHAWVRHDGVFSHMAGLGQRK